MKCRGRDVKLRPNRSAVELIGVRLPRTWFVRTSAKRSFIEIHLIARLRHLTVRIRLVFVVAIAFLAANCAKSSSPERPLLSVQSDSLTRGDTTALRIATIGVLLDSLAGPNDGDGRIWISRTGDLRSQPGAASAYALSDSEWMRIAAHYSSAKLIEHGDSALMCPPGVQLRMPESGCPIREGGIILGLGPVQLYGDSAASAGWILRSTSSQQRTLSWIQGMVLIFEPLSTGWRLRHVRTRSTT
jgi:hypothetical protein